MSDQRTEKFISQIKAANNPHIVDIRANYGYAMIIVARENLHELCSWLKDEHHFSYLVDVVATDRFTSQDRFEVIYNIMNLRTQTRVFVKTFCTEKDPTVDTIADIWPASNWYEREAFDMLGIRFNNHPDLRRIYMPEDFEYYPLRKEFPLLGIPGSLQLPDSTPDTE